MVYHEAIKFRWLRERIRWNKPCVLIVWQSVQDGPYYFIFNRNELFLIEMSVFLNSNEFFLIEMNGSLWNEMTCK